MVIDMQLSYFQKINNLNNTTNYSDSDLYNLKQQINDGFADTIDYHIVEKLDGTKQELIIVHQKDKNKKTIKSRPDEKIDMGELYQWNEHYWLVTEVDSDSQIYCNAQIQECNYTLPYQLNSSTILQEPCIVDNLQETTIGQNQGNLITVPSHLLNVFVQYNDNTSKIEIGKHLYIDRPCPHPSVYEITQIDRVTYMNGEHGLLKFTCNASTIGDKDRTDLLIADYISDTPVVPSETGSVTITSPDNAFTVDFGSSKTFTAIYKDSSGQALSGITSVWSYILPDGYQDKIHITVNDNNISIKTDSDFNLIDKVITISVHDNGNTYSATQDIKVVSGFGI